MNTKYQIIYLNGPSSSSKTTLAHLLQQELDLPFLHIGIDRVVGMMPDLKDYNVLWVGIHTPLPLLEQREKQRGNRMIGSAKAQYYQVHKGVIYDLEFDTGKDSSEKTIHDIKEKLCSKSQ